MVVALPLLLHVDFTSATCSSKWMDGLCVYVCVRVCVPTTPSTDGFYRVLAVNGCMVCVCVCVCVWVGGWVGVGVCDYAGSRCLEEEKNLSLANSIEERLPGYQTELAVISEEERV